VAAPLRLELRFPRPPPGVREGERAKRGNSHLAAAPGRSVPGGQPRSPWGGFCRRSLDSGRGERGEEAARGDPRAPRTRGRGGESGAGPPHPSLLRRSGAAAGWPAGKAPWGPGEERVRAGDGAVVCLQTRAGRGSGVRTRFFGFRGAGRARRRCRGSPVGLVSRKGEQSAGRWCAARRRRRLCGRCQTRCGRALPAGPIRRPGSAARRGPSVLRGKGGTRAEEEDALQSQLPEVAVPFSPALPRSAVPAPGRSPQR